MLYDRWRQVARDNQRETALRETATGRHWTFGQLLAWSDAAPAPAGPIHFPEGSHAGFILEVLRAWRHGTVLCPLETDQPPGSIIPPPPGIVHLKRTSATSGAARLVAFTAEQLAADPANIVASMGLRPDWPNVGAISLAHSYGFSNLVLPLLLHGIPLILPGSPLPEALRAALASVPEVTLPGVPALWRAWHAAGVPGPSVRLAISAGAPLPAPLEEAVFHAHGIKIHNFYGSSECGGIAYDRTGQPRPDPSLAGTPLDNVAVGHGADGCLEVSGRGVAERYWPEASPALAHGVFRTTDLVELHEGGIFMRGRASDVIHVAGRKVSPEEIERVLLRHPSVQACLVVGLPKPGEEGGEYIGAVVASADQAGVKAWAAGQLPAWQSPRRWHFVESLPANERGKTPRAEWRRRLMQAGPPA